MTEVLDALGLLADEVLDADGKVKFGDVGRIKDWQKIWKIRFMECGFAKLLDVDFDILLGCPRDLLHHILLGVFGSHIVNAIVHAIKKSLSHDNYFAKFGPGRKENIFK